VKRALATLALIAAGGCGGSTTTGPATPPPEFNNNVVVFYDENANGLLDATETIRLADVLLESGARNARTTAAGRATLSLTAGAQTVTVDERSLPPFFVVKPLALTSPAAADLLLPATLPIGDNRTHTYMAFGDSLTTRGSYPEDLTARLVAYWGKGNVVNEGQYGTRSGDGANRVTAVLKKDRAAYTLILYGTNDWGISLCRSEFPCDTIENLRFIIDTVKARQSLPFLATIPPVNAGYNDTVPPERNEWIARMNVLIRALAVETGAVLVDVEKAWLAQPEQRPLYADQIHPSAKGSAVIADAFFAAVVRRQ
jgi:lysophospholipase L1-like esterase